MFYMYILLSCFSYVQLLLTLWTVAHQAHLSMDSPGKNTGLGCHLLLQGILLTQGSNLCFLKFLHYRRILYHWATGEAQFHMYIFNIYFYVFIWLHLVLVISKSQICRWYHPYGRKQRTKDLLNETERGKLKSCLKAQYHGIWSHHFMVNRLGNNGNCDRLYFEGAPKSL